MTEIERLTMERDEARAEVDVLDKLMRQHRTASVGTIDRLEETEAELREEIRRLNDEVFALRRESLRLATDLERVEKERDEERAEVERLRDGFAIMASSLEARCRQADDATAEVDRLTRIDRALAREGDYVRQLINSYRASALGAQAMEKIATSKLLELSAKHEDLCRDLASRDREVLDLRAQLDEATLDARRR